MTGWTEASETEKRREKEAKGWGRGSEPCGGLQRRCHERESRSRQRWGSRQTESKVKRKKKRERKKKRKKNALQGMVYIFKNIHEHFW